MHNQSTQRHGMPCSVLQLYVHVARHGNLCPTAPCPFISQPLSVYFSHPCSTKAFFFFFIIIWTNSCSKYFQYPFWSHELMLTHFIVCGSGPHGEFVNGRLAQPALFLKHAAHILHYRSYHRSLGSDITILQEWSHFFFFFLPHSSSQRGGGDILPQ